MSERAAIKLIASSSKKFHTFEIKHGYDKHLYYTFLISIGLFKVGPNMFFSKRSCLYLVENSLYYLVLRSWSLLMFAGDTSTLLELNIAAWSFTSSSVLCNWPIRSPSFCKTKTTSCQISFVYTNLNQLLLVQDEQCEHLFSWFTLNHLYNLLLTK